jgi:electron transport complex protein RnfB
MTNTFGNRMIKIDGGIIGPRDPSKKTVKAKNVKDYPGVSKAHLEVAEIYSSHKLGGPPICDELIALMLHTFTEEEADIARHIKPRIQETAASVAAAAHRPVEEVREILESLANKKSALTTSGSGEEKTYSHLPMAAGFFERVLMRTSMDTLTDWHRRFAELFEKLWETGFATEYWQKPKPRIRYLPMGQIIESHPMALPSDKLPELFSRYDTFAVTLCQCRLVENLIERDCGRPMEVCMAIGQRAEPHIKSGRFRPIERKEALEIKALAEASGLVSWFSTRDPEEGFSCCSCCGCCCHMMRSVSEFNMPSLIAPPHFMPKVLFDRCNYCGKCALACPMGAVTVDTQNNTYTHDPRRCIGCAQCALACDKLKAIEMQAVPGYEELTPFRKQRTETNLI